ncbi:hypothetical protein [Tolypothrix sp. VBCCA 56010]|uniref:hypothetical protein n=1 Tax=Tolypothrix sp. VBCCA 56010 TaxID=3137731 RepID=UPI003D7CBD6E
MVVAALIGFLAAASEPILKKTLSVLLSGVLGLNSLTFNGYLTSHAQANAAVSPQSSELITNKIVESKGISSNEGNNIDTSNSEKSSLELDSTTFTDFKKKVAVCLPFVGCTEDVIKRGANEVVKNQLRSFFKDEIPIVGTEHKFYPKNKELPGKPFSPKTLYLISLKDSDVLPPSDYEIPAHFYCTKVYTLNGSGNRYVLAKLDGKMAKALSTLYQRASRAGVPIQDVQVLSWSMQAGVPYSSLPQNSQALVDKLIPEYRDKMDVSFYDKTINLWSQISRQTSLPSFDQVLNDMGDIGNFAQSLLKARQEVLRTNFSYHPLADAFVIPKDANLAGGTSETSWSKVHEQVYMRFIAPSGALNDGVIQVRVLESSSKNKSAIKEQKIAQIAQAIPLPAPIPIPHPGIILGGILVGTLIYIISQSVAIPESTGHQALTSTLTMSRTGDGGGGDRRPPRDLCNKAVKILTQYERLAKKFGVNLGDRRLAELNRLRDAGQITINQIPGTLRGEFPTGNFGEMTLQQIRDLCGM